MKKITTKNIRLAGLVLGLSLWGASPAWAIATTELTTESTVTDTKGSHQLSMTMDVSAEGILGRLTKTQGGDTGFPDTIYDNKQMALVNPSQKSYTTIADIEKAFGPMAGMMAGMMPKLDFKETSDSMNVGKWRCKKFLVLQNGKEAGHECAANYKDLGLTDPEIATIRGIYKQYESFRKLTGSFNPATFMMKDGYPIDGKIDLNFAVMGHAISTSSTSQLKDAKQVDMPAEKFKVPAGYKHVTEIAEMRPFFAGK